MTSLFRRITKYSPSALADPQENRLTEAFAAMLEHSSSLAAALVGAWFGVKPSGRPRVRTQRPTASEGYVDLELAFGPDGVPDLIVWIEVKHGAPVELEQLVRYADDIERVPAAARTLGVLAPRTSMPDSVDPATPLTWQGVARFLRRWRPPDDVDSAVGEFLVHEFLSFLEEEGLSDAPALTAAHAFALAARPAADRTVATLLELASEHVRREWGEPSKYLQVPGSKKPNYGPGWWAAYAPAPAKQTSPPTWGSTWFEWGLRPDRARRNARDAFAFDAGAAFEAKRSPVKVAGNDAWLLARTAAGFEYLQEYWWRLVEHKYPEELLVETSIEGQAELLGAWVVAVFRELAATPPPQ